jgi:hypothetical protein
VILGVPNTIAIVAGFVQDELRQGPRTKRSLVMQLECSASTVQRALTWLRELGAPLRYCRARGRWYLDDPDWRPPVWRLGRHGMYLEQAARVAESTEPHQTDMVKYGCGRYPR